MQQVSKGRKKRRVKKKTKLEKRIDKWSPYFIVALFTYTLYSTQFFPIFFQHQREARERYVQPDAPLIISAPSDVLRLTRNLQEYFTNIVLNLDFTQMYTFLFEGFAFGGMIQPENSLITVPQPNDFSFLWGGRNEEGDGRTPLPNLGTDPIVKLLNAHPHEMVNGVGMWGSNGFVEVEVGDVNIVDLTHVMGEYLQELGVPTFVETRDVRDILRERGWLHGRSHCAAGILLQETLETKPSVQFFFDIHRDALTRNQSTVAHNGNYYAQIMFVIGQDNPTAHENRAMANRLHQMLNDRVPGLSRAVRDLGRPTHNGIYNQNLHGNIQLLEIGGVENTEEEMKNTIRILSEVIADYISLVTRN